VMIAMAIACEPALLIADEPTTALDVTTQAQILDLFNEIREKTGSGLIFISHDLGVIGEVAGRTLVFYAGRVLEDCPTQELFLRPLHPYTAGLLKSRLGRSAAFRGQRLYAIPGTVPPAGFFPPGCPFAPRCPQARPVCTRSVPPLVEAAPGHRVRCFGSMEKGEENE